MNTMDEKARWFALIDNKILEHARAIGRLMLQRDSRSEFREYLERKKELNKEE